MLIARWRRFWHCLWFTIVDCEHPHGVEDFVQYPVALPTRFLFGAPCKIMELTCECGKVFWIRETGEKR